jgi:nucleotide-binding universal stress UspA family protein
MTLFKHVLVPTDFGQAAQAALDLALSVASSSEATLTLFHAYVIPMPLYSEAAWAPAEALERESRKALDEALAKTRKRYPRTEAILACGDPAQEIVAAVVKGGADLIVMGTHGRRGLSRVLLGSVAEKVVRLSPVPVLTVPGAADRDAKREVASRDAT